MWGMLTMTEKKYALTLNLKHHKSVQERKRKRRWIFYWQQRNVFRLCLYTYKWNEMLYLYNVFRCTKSVCGIFKRLWWYQSFTICTKKKCEYVCGLCIPFVQYFFDLLSQMLFRLTKIICPPSYHIKVWLNI